MTATPDHDRPTTPDPLPEDAAVRPTGEGAHDATPGARADGGESTPTEELRSQIFGDEPAETTGTVPAAASPDAPRTAAPAGGQSADPTGGTEIGGATAQPEPGTTVGGDGLVYSTRPRPMTVVWGAMLMLAGVALVAWAFGARFDLLITGSTVLAVAGVALIASAIGSSVRSRGRR